MRPDSLVRFWHYINWYLFTYLLLVIDSKQFITSLQNRVYATEVLMATELLSYCIHSVVHAL